MTDTQESTRKNRIGKALAGANVIKFGEFTYVSGKKGPIYVDMRLLPSTPSAMDEVTDELASLVTRLKPDVIAGAETAGIPLAAVVSFKTGIPMVYVRKKPKEYGGKSRIEGFIGHGDKVVLIDDMITDGGSKKTFIDGIREANGVITDTIVVLDRQQGGGETLEQDDVKLHSLINLGELLEYMKDNSLLDNNKYEEVLEYLGR